MFAADYDMNAYIRIIKKDYQRMLAEKDVEIADKDAEIADKDAEIARLKKVIASKH